MNVIQLQGILGNEASELAVVILNLGNPTPFYSKQQKRWLRQMI